MRTTVLSSMLSLLLLCGPAGMAHVHADTPHSTAQDHDIPMWMQGGHPTVAVQVNNSVEPLHFVIDSAAGATVIDETTARRIGLEDPTAEGVAVEGATDRSALLRRSREAHWRVGSLSFHAAAMQTDLSRLGRASPRRIDGILGNDITHAYDVTFDIVGQRVTLQPPGTLKLDSACAANALPHRDASMAHFGFVVMQLGTQKIDAVAVIDTGAAQTILNGAAANALGLSTDGSDQRLRVRETGTRGLGERAIETWLYTLPSLAMGPWAHAPLEVRISELPVFASLGLKERPALILGADAMLDARVQISAGAAHICLR
ncbi:aspartyl protease family protein [Luteimonas sp. RIT-PG2_3]